MIAAVMLVKDEADIIGWTVQHLLDENVDRIWVADNRSSDGTREILDRIAACTNGQVRVIDDPDPGYWQAQKTTALAMRAWEDGARWIIPCDADEIWQAPRTATLGSFLRGQGPDVQVVRATILNHVVTSSDDASIENPIRRLQWRLDAPGALPKVACRAAGDLSIHMGNHGCDYAESPYVNTVGGLVVRHFSWRSEEQYLRKIRNGQAAYAATDLPDTFGGHWRMFDGADDDAIREHFRRWFCDPDDPIVHDPVRAWAAAT